jgi:glyoxylase-like metal-dependent hydrolase (beta-lactamase superfamily II)
MNENDSVPPEIVRISVPTPFAVGPANVFLLKTDPPALIDTGPGTDDAYERLVSQLEKHGISLGDLGYILLTHGHLDHSGMLGRLQKSTNAVACAHPIVAEQFANYDWAIEATCEYYRVKMTTLGAPREVIDAVLKYRLAAHTIGTAAAIQHVLRDGEEVSGVRAIFVAGHSPGDVLYYEPAQRAAFTGDHVLKGMSPSPLMSVKDDPSVPVLTRYCDSLRITRELDIDRCHPGHGSPFGNHRAIIDDILRRYDERLEQVARLVEETRQTPYQIMTRMFPNISRESLQFGVSMAAEYLKVLAVRGRVIEEREESGDGAVFYRK